MIYQTATGPVDLTPAHIRLAWMVGELSYRLRNIQKRIRKAWIESREKSHKFYIECPRRLGKSTFLLMLENEFCIKRPGSRAGFYAPVKDGLRDYIVPIINKVFADCPDEFKPNLDANLTLTYPNGSSIIFRGSNNQQHNRRRGVDLDIAGIDEARDVDDLDSLIDSVIMPALFNSAGPLVISSTPADTDDHPLKAVRDAAEKEGWMFHCDIMTAHENDPQEFPMDRINKWREETRDVVAWQREYMALWVKDPTKIIIPEWSDSCAVDTSLLHDEYFPYYQKYVALDSGVQDKTAGIFAYYDFKRAKIIVEDEFTLQDSEVRTDRIAEAVKSKERALFYQVLHDPKDDKFHKLELHERVFRRVADNDNLILINDLNSLYQLNFYPTQKDELAAMINLVREFVKDMRILIDRRCLELLGCVRNAIWDKNKRQLARSKTYGHFDALMALVYLVRNVSTTTNPIPQYFGKNWATHAGVPANMTPNIAAYQLQNFFNKKTDHEAARDNFVRGRV